MILKHRKHFLGGPDKKTGPFVYLVDEERFSMWVETISAVTVFLAVFAICCLWLWVAAVAVGVA